MLIVVPQLHLHLMLTPLILLLLLIQILKMNLVQRLPQGPVILYQNRTMLLPEHNNNISHSNIINFPTIRHSIINHKNMHHSHLSNHHFNHHHPGVEVITSVTIKINNTVFIITNNTINQQQVINNIIQTIIIMLLAMVIKINYKGAKKGLLLHIKLYKEAKN